MEDDIKKCIGDIDALIDKHNGNPQTKVSEKKLLANRANASNSTGPRTAEGKKRSRRNSLKHGLLARSVMFDAKGEPDADFLTVYHALREQYAAEDVGMVLRLDVLFTDYWRMVQATKAEAALIKAGGVSHLGSDWAQKLHRYMTASRNCFMKGLDVLEKLKAKQGDLEDAESDEEPDPDLCVTEAEDTEATTPIKPTVDHEIQQPPAEEASAAPTTELPPRQLAKPMAAPDNHDGVPESDLLPRKSTG